MNLQEHIRRILREDKELNPNKRVYDYDKERDTVPERLPFDIDKLVNSGVVFVTPAIDGDPDSKTYKKWLEEPYTHLISLYNVEHSSEDGWVKKAITKGAPTKAYKDNFVDKIYDGKYNQILWGLEKLGINPMDMLIDTNIQENIRKVLREELGLSPRFLRRVPMDKLEESFGHALKLATKKYYRYRPILNEDYKLHFFTKEVVELLLDSVSHLMYPTIKGSWYDEEFSNVKKHFKDRITEWWETLD